MAESNEQLVEICRNRSFYLGLGFRDEKVFEAMRLVDRADFVLNSSSAYFDRPVDIGYGQTCSQPSMVAFMCDILELKEGMKVLEVGSGCGYHAAITSHLIGQGGFLTTLEYIPELARMARKNLRRHFGSKLVKMVEVVQGDGSVGYPKNGPYDRIYLTAGISLKSFDPLVLAKQLNSDGGILIFPEGEGFLFKQVYVKRKLVMEKSYERVSFVPLRGKNS